MSTVMEVNDTGGAILTIVGILILLWGAYTTVLRAERDELQRKLKQEEKDYEERNHEANLLRDERDRLQKNYDEMLDVFVISRLQRGDDDDESED